MNANNEELKQMIEELIPLDKHELMIRFGTLLLQKKTMNLKSYSVKEYIEISQKYFDIILPYIRKNICSHKEKILTKKSSCAAYIVDLIVGQCGGIPAVFTALYILDMGIENYCKNYA